MSVGIYPFDVFSLLSPVAASSRGASPERNAGLGPWVKGLSSDAGGQLAGDREPASSKRERR